MGFVKNSVLALTTVIALGVFSGAANASLLIEPHVGYIVGGTSDFTSSGTNVALKWNGPDYGARLGGQWLGFQAGLDYSHSTFDLELAALGTTVKTAQKRDMLGAFVGYKFPILLRAWATYFFSGKTTATETTTSSNSGDFTKGKGMELGVGFTGLPIVNLNLSYRTSTQDKDETGAMNPEIKTKEFLLSVSAPFTLL